MNKKKLVDKHAKKAAIYCRVSTYNQSQGDYSSLNTQEELLRSFCKTREYELHDTYIDTKTGTTIEREHLSRLLKDAADKKFDVVIATKLDRISRSMKDFFEINEVLASNNIDLVLATQNIDTTSSMGRFNRNVLMAFAEFERDMIAERTKEKLFAQAQKGYWGGGVVPIGYDVKDKKLVVNESEKELVQRIFKYYLENPSSHQVSRRLNEEGYLTKVRVSKNGSKTGGVKFHKNSVKDILRNSVYTGWIKYKNERFSGVHTAIVDKDLFDKVQERIDQSIVETKITVETESPLTLLGITKCAHCGSLLSTSSTFKKEQQKRYYFYKCSKAAHQTKEHCPARDIPADALESTVMDALQFLVNDDEFLNSITKQISGNAGDDINQLNTDITDLKRNQVKISQKLGSLMDRLTDDSKLKTSETVSKTIGDLENQKADIAILIQSKQRELEKAKTGEVDIAVLKEMLSDFCNLYVTYSPMEKRRLNHLVFAGIVSNFKRSEESGYLEIQIRGDGSIRKTWEEIKRKVQSAKVRTSGPSGSAGRARTYNPMINSNKKAVFYIDNC
jgi:site-specific DNA recombinase